MTDNRDSLNEKVEQWVNTEGYPLEFRFARAFRRAGFRVFQGYYTHDPNSGTPREIDVYASIDLSKDDLLLRVSFIIECKYIVDKPWVVFTSTAGHISPSACVAQTISSKLGDACLWYLAGDKLLKENSLFSAPHMPGFNGAQAFSKKNDQDRVYSTLQDVISKTFSEAKSADASHKDETKMPRFCHVLFPVIGVDGRLFEAHYDSNSEKIKTKNVDKSRIHWRGSEKWRRHSTVDIVKVEAVECYAIEAHRSAEALLKLLDEQCQKVRVFFKTKKIIDQDTSCSGRGVIGIPALFRPLLAQGIQKQKKTKSSRANKTK